MAKMTDADWAVVQDWEKEWARLPPVEPELDAAMEEASLRASPSKAVDSRAECLPDLNIRLHHKSLTG